MTVLRGCPDKAELWCGVMRKVCLKMGCMRRESSRSQDDAMQLTRGHCTGSKPGADGDSIGLTSEAFSPWFSEYASLLSLRIPLE